MRIMNKIVLITLLTLNLGCSTVLNSTKDIAQIVIADDQIMSGQVTSTIKSGTLSSTDNMIVDHAINTYVNFANRWKKEVTTIDSTTPLFIDFISDYNDLVRQYRAIETIIAKNWESYPTRSQAALLDYQLRAKKVNASVDKLILAAKAREAVLDAIVFAKILAGIALK